MNGFECTSNTLWLQLRLYFFTYGFVCTSNRSTSYYRTNDYRTKYYRCFYYRNTILSNCIIIEAPKPCHIIEVMTNPRIGVWIHNFLLMSIKLYIYRCLKSPPKSGGAGGGSPLINIRVTHRRGAGGSSPLNYHSSSNI